MKTITALFLGLCLAGLPLAGSSAATTSTPAQDGQYQYQQQGDPNYYDPYTPEQLDNLLAPIALYPDPLLAQVLIAATFPDQIQDAADWVRRYGPYDRGLDDQPWDISVRAVAHYPAVLYMMNDKIDWTAAVGQAYVNQSTDTMASVQNLRGLARAEGNLFSTPQQQVVDYDGYIQILPAQPQYIFVPTYDAGAIYSRRVYNGNSFGAFFSFGSGFAIGTWLNYDLDWGSRRVVYNNWQGDGWRQRSRPFVQVNNNVYVNNRYQNVVVNRTVVNRQVNFQKVNQFNSVHSDAKFDNRPRGNGQPVGRPNGGNPNNDPNRNPRTVQPSQPQRPDDSFNRGGLKGGGQQGQPNPAVQQQPPVVQQNNQRPNNNDNRGGQRGGGQQGQPSPAVQQQPPVVPQNNQRPNIGDNGGGQRGGGQGQPAPAVQQQPPAVPQNNQRPNDSFNRGGLKGGGQQNQSPQNQSPQNPTPDHNVRGQGQNQAPPTPPVPQQAPPPPQRNAGRPNDNPNRGQQDQPPPPAKVEQAKPAPPPPQPAAAPAGRQQGGQQGGNGNKGQGQGQKDNKDNKDNKDGKDRPN